MRDKEPKDNFLISNKNVILGTVITGAGVVLLLFFTTPDRLGPSGVTAFFGLVFIFVLGLVELYYRRFEADKTYWPFWLRMVYTALPVVLLAMSSLRQLEVLDIVAAIGLVLVINVYHNRQIN